MVFVVKGWNTVKIISNVLDSFQSYKIVAVQMMNEVVKPKNINQQRRVIK